MKKLVLIFFVLNSLTLCALGGPADDAIKSAKAALDNGDLQAAAKEADDGLALDPENFKLLRLTGNIYFELAQFESALGYYERALAKKKKDAKTLYGAGMAALKIEKFEDAEGYFERGVKTGKMKDKFLYGLGFAQTELGKYLEADLNLRKAIDKKKSVAAYHLELAEENYRNKVYTIAITNFEKAMELDSTYAKTIPDLHYKIGESYLNLHNVIKAIEEYRKGLALFPDDIVAWKKLARICEASDKPAEAAFCGENIVRIQPDNGEWWFKLGAIYNRLRDKEKSAAAYEKAVELNYNAAESFGQLAKLYGERKEYEKAWDAYNRFEKVVGLPDSTLYWYAKGKVGNKIGAKNTAYFDSALFAFQKAIAYDSTYSPAYERAGLSLYYKKQYSAAIPYFKKKIELDSMGVNSLRNLAFCYLKTESYALAAETFEKALVVKPEDIQMRTMLGKIYSFNKRYNDSVRHFEILLNDYSEVITDSIRCVIYPDLGMSYLSDLKCKKATQILLKAEKCRPNDVSILLNLATSYHTCNLIKDANIYYKKVLRIDPNNKDAIRGDLETTIQGQD